VSGEEERGRRRGRERERERERKRQEEQRLGPWNDWGKMVSSWSGVVVVEVAGQLKGAG